MSVNSVLLKETDVVWWEEEIRGKLRSDNYHNQIKAAFTRIFIRIFYITFMIHVLCTICVIL